MIILSDNLNTQICRTLKTSPYEVVYGQPPRSTPFPVPSSGTIMEEDVPDLIDESGKVIIHLHVYWLLVCAF